MFGVGRAPAQTADARPAAPPAWTASIGAGLALTGGNSDTSSYNLSLAAAYDPKRRNSLKAEGRYLRSDTQGEASADKTALGLRDEYRLNGRAFLFGEARYLRDVFKGIRYLVSPLLGSGVRLLDGERAKLAVDAALGWQFEEEDRREPISEGALQAGERLSLKLSEGASLTQQATALFKLQRPGDALFRFEIGLAASISRHTELKLTFSDDFKTRPSDPSRKRHDTSLVAALVLKLE